MNSPSADRQQRALRLQACVLSHPQLREAATALAAELAALEGCSRVSVGWAQEGLVQLIALSHGNEGEPGDLKRPAFNPIAAAMDEAVQQATCVWVPASDGLLVRLAHQGLAAGRGGAALTVPVAAHGQLIGALTLEWTEVPADLPARAALIEAELSLTGPVLQLLHERGRSLWQRLRARVHDWTHRAGARRMAWATAAGALAVVGLLAWPVEHRVGGQARIEGEQQRSVVAPQDGFIAEVPVRPGDQVRKGQLLLALSDDEPKLQQRRWQSDLAQHENAYASALAQSDRAAMVIALARADKARAQLAMAQAELQRARIVAPMDGVVVQGDWSQAIGAPVERGRELLTIAPLANYRVTVQVNERDIARVQVGQPGHLSLSALPWDALPLTVRRIGPLAQAVDGGNVFEVETDIGDETAKAALRPGLEGVAKLAVGHAPLGWLLLHRTASWLRLRLWSWWP